ncbi:MAG TPA: dicarboxylate/amino acid:cation symporter [Candidatus Krumholzibacteria bacterium]|nr:dicarboxylate/amino acid:cation symporter [Candidatus Krumholzibacteria bacterium]HPD70178.1 dicarboxylate/amino acid:cation symporter [Candidatus Krumholzibacteria bacterium]HRY40122.1 dicarboxylate/amino acid:cation symporter [Candidatus Krumholzibacteria bacterium]
MAHAPAPAPSGRALTVKILAGMALGIVAGVILSLADPPADPSAGPAVADSWARQWLTDGILRVVGQAFVRLLQVMVIPLVLVSLICGAAAMEDVAKVGRVGVKTLVLYLATTALAIILAVAAALLVRPGAGFPLAADVEFKAEPPPPLGDVLLDIVPSNIFAAMAAGQMLPIILFAILFGLALTMAGAPGKRLLAVLQDANAVVMSLVWLVMLLAPVGVFALVARTFATQGFGAFAPLGKYAGLVILVLALHALVVYPAILRILGRIDPRPFLRKMREVQVFAFSTASSNATIPVNLRVVETGLGVKNSIAAFTIPLGATVNMDGTAIMQGVATVFVAQVYGVDLSGSQLVTVVLTATLASIGTAGVPGVGLIMLAMVLQQVGLPVAGIGLIIGIDRLLDMARTAVNVTGDSLVACIVARSEGEWDAGVYGDRAGD